MAIGKCIISVRKAALEAIWSRKCTQEYRLLTAELKTIHYFQIMIVTVIMCYWIVMLVIVASRAMLRMKTNALHVFQTTKRF
jgi:hypothetical protein